MARLQAQRLDKPLPTTMLLLRALKPPASKEVVDT